MNSKIIVHKLSNTNISLSYKKLEKYYEDNIKRVNYNHKFTLTCKTKDSKPNIICIEYILRESDIIKLKDFLKKEIFSDNDIIKQEDSKDSKDLIKKKIFTPLSENKFKKELFNKLSKDKVQLIEEENLKTIDIKIGGLCSKCLCKIENKSRHYFCYWCQIYFCRECGADFDLSKSGLEVLPHIHNLIRIQVNNESSSMKNIDFYKLGNNYYTSNLIFHQRHFNTFCNLCKMPTTNSARYLCLSCRPGTFKKEGYVDLCEFCVNNQNNSSNLYLINNCFKSCHDPKTHIFLRLYYSSGFYNKY